MSNQTTNTVDARVLMASAAGSTGLEDYGRLDFIEPLDQFLDSVQNEARLGPMGLEGLKADILRLLTNRLRIQAAITAHPEILDEDVSDPILITGLPRTGSTKLHKVLGSRPGTQTLPLWQALNPAPLVETHGSPDPRITFADEQSAMLAQHAPEFMAAHPMRTHEPEEEVLLMQLSFRTFTNGWFYRAPSYVDWVMLQDQTPAYHDTRTALQYLQWQNGGRQGRPWVLKSPAHLGTIDVVFATFPKATVVHCHRAPHEAIGSLTRFIDVVRRSRGAEDVDAVELGQFLREFCAQLWSRNLTQREHLDGRQILDVRYEDIRDDIAPVLREIHARRGSTLDDDTVQTMLAWQDENPQHRFGKHTYNLEQYSLTREDIDATFGHYLDRFPTRSPG